MLRMPGYTLPDDGYFRTLNISGGATSGMMGMEISRAHGGEIPADKAVLVFNNTGKEREETLEFVRDLTEIGGLPIRWLEFRYRESPGPGQFAWDFEEVTFETASRKGEPFSALNRAAKILPNAVMRKCTSELKVLTTSRFCERSLGVDKAKIRNVLGIRFDEPERWKKHLMNPEGCQSDYPLVTQRVTRSTVEEYWKGQNFQLGIPSSLSNCDLCFLKGKAHLLGVIRAEPWRADWWVSEERLIAKAGAQRDLEKQEQAHFSSRWSFEELLALATQSDDLFADLFDQLGPDDSVATDCLCTD